MRDNIEFIGQSVEYVGGYGGDDTIESAARTCTQTVGRKSASDFVRGLARRGHMSPTEFGFADFLLEVDRAIQQELTRHRHFSFNIESTRWINYLKKPVRFVTKPAKGWDVPDEAVELLERWCELSVLVYEALLALHADRDYARKAWPLALASNVRMAGNSRAWFEMIAKRIVGAAHPEAREVAVECARELGGRFVGLFSAKAGGRYRPRQHTARPQGSNHTVVSANVELWDDDPPASIELGSHTYTIESA
jgi:thymidylate synthase (FAD)